MDRKETKKALPNQKLYSYLSSKNHNSVKEAFSTIGYTNAQSKYLYNFVTLLYLIEESRSKPAQT